MKRAASWLLALGSVAASAAAQDAALTAAPIATAAPAAVSACVACHSDPARVPRAEAREPVANLADDIHAQRGLFCHDCHGGRPDVDLAAPDAQARAHDAAAGYVGRPAPADGPAFCGRCHSDAATMARFNPDARVDQETKYRTSVHGERLAKGDTKVASCISCHGRHPGGEKSAALAHGIRAVGDPQSPVHPLNVAATCGRCHGDAEYMAEYGIPTDQREEYEHSVHRAALVEKEDLAAPTCNDCHGNHGARPPEVESMAFVCGTCHAKQAELFRQTKMKPAFDEAELGECIVCHGNHGIVAPSDELLFHAPLAEGEAQTGCYTCHPDASDAALAISTAVHADLGALEGRIAEARATLADADAKGMPVAEAEYELTGATDALVEARALVHLFRREPVDEACTRGTKVADSALAQGHAAIEAFYFRHRWLGVSLLGIAFVILSLWLKLRQVDRRWRASAPAGPAAR
ncbi:MAG TPA: hypothetical protein VMV01_01895 [Planctomycetota bacterium]|nr:hypothetical protein [Planctomycetota bacterium]